VHKIRNVEDRLPDKLRSVVAARMRRPYHAESALAAEAELCALAAELDRTHPGAAASLREGMAATLTVLRLGVPPTPTRTLRSTNAIESMISICRTHGSNVKRWRDRLSPSSTVHSLDCDATSRRISARLTQASKVTYTTRLGDHIDVLGHPVFCCLICALCVTLCVPSTHRDKLVTSEDDAVCQESRLLLEDRQEAGPCLLNYFQTYQKRLCVSETSGNVIP